MDTASTCQATSTASRNSTGSPCPDVEPWKSLYILRRGVLPCCYGGEPIAPMDDYDKAWNGPLIQAIRAELVAGRFHDYCLSSPSCPIVRKSFEARSLPLGQRVRLRIRRWNAAFDHMTTHGARHVTRPIRWIVVRIIRAATDPTYLVRHVRSLFGVAPRK